MTLFNNKKYYLIYEDSGYLLCFFSKISYGGGSPFDCQTAFNASMSSVRFTMEVFIKESKTCWSFVDCILCLRVLQMPVGLIYHAAVLHTNFRNRIKPNQTSQYFNCRTPTV